MAPRKTLPDAARFSMALTSRQHDLLGREATRLRISLAELIRRILDEWLGRRA